MGSAYFCPTMNRRTIMRMSKLFASTILATVVGTGAALADPVSFTWNPSGAGISTAGPFTASNITVADFAKIDISNPGVVVEDAILRVQSFNATTPGLVSGSGLIAGATPYALYFVVHTTSHLTNVPFPGHTFLAGAFDSISYTLMGDMGGNCTFGASFGAGPTASCGLDTQVALATGSLGNGTNQVSILDGIPSAAVDVTIDSALPGFWLSPAILSNLLFVTDFTNNNLETTVGTGANAGLILVGACVSPRQPCPGGGSFDLTSVPEPITVSLFGAGLAGAAALRRRRKAKKA